MKVPVIINPISQIRVGQVERHRPLSKATLGLIATVLYSTRKSIMQ